MELLKQFGFVVLDIVLMRGKVFYCTVGLLIAAGLIWGWK